MSDVNTTAIDMSVEAMLTVPVRNVLVRDTRGDIEHDNATLPVDVITISETAKLLLPCGIPHVELNHAKVLQLVSSRRL